MTYFIGIAIAIVVLIALIFLGKILVVILAKKLAVSLAKKAINSATLFAKDQIQTLAESKDSVREE